MQINPTDTDRLIHMITFDVPIKYICPPALLGLFVNQAIYDATQFDNGYADYPNWLQSVAGVLVLGTMFGSLILFAVYPDFWDMLGVDENQGKQIATYEPAVRSRSTHAVSFASHKVLCWRLGLAVNGIILYVHRCLV